MPMMSNLILDFFSKSNIYPQMLKQIKKKTKLKHE